MFSHSSSNVFNISSLLSKNHYFVFPEPPCLLVFGSVILLPTDVSSFKVALTAPGVVHGSVPLIYWTLLTVDFRTLEDWELRLKGPGGELVLLVPQLRLSRWLLRVPVVRPLMFGPGNSGCISHAPFASYQDAQPPSTYCRLLHPPWVLLHIFLTSYLCFKDWYSGAKFGDFGNKQFYFLLHVPACLTWEHRGMKR